MATKNRLKFSIRVDEDIDDIITKLQIDGKMKIFMEMRWLFWSVTRCVGTNNKMQIH